MIALGSVEIVVCPGLGRAGVRDLLEAGHKVADLAHELETELQATRWVIELVREVVAPERLAQQIHQRSRGTYSAWRVHAALRLGHHALGSHGAVELPMQRAGLHTLSGRPKRRRAKPDQIAVDRVDRAFAQTATLVTSSSPAP